MSSFTGDSTSDGDHGSVADPTPVAGKASRNPVTDAFTRSSVFASAVRFVTDPARWTTAARIFSRSATTESQSESTLFASALRYSSCASPPSCSLTYPATESCASRRPAATECPPAWTLDSIPVRDSFTSCLKTSLSVSFASRSISVMRSCIIPDCADVHLPRSMRYAATSSLPRMDDVKGERENPPVCAPMVWSNSTKSRLFVPMRCIARHHSGTSGMRSMGTAWRSMRCSAYRMSFVNRSCVSTVVSPMDDVSLGIALDVFGMSPISSVGTHAVASGESGVSCNVFSSSVSATTLSMSSGDRPARYSAIRVFSSASCFDASVASGFNSTVTLCALSINSFFSSGLKTSPAAIFALRSASGPSNRSGWNGSFSYSHALRDRSMSDRPRGNRPVLFSRMLNSIVFTEESIASRVNPSSAIFAIVASINASTLGTSSFATPLRPIANVG
mmetsp:Transcript_5534/g.20010  ORF Transcript_5534/g.20010 Transcript_5534/m.20010 type:complete len:448 (+) Transcript_5534:739-2082(+)